MIDIRLFAAQSDFFDNTKRGGHGNKYLYIRSQVTRTESEHNPAVFRATL